MLILRAEMFSVGANVNVEKVKLWWCSILCPPAPTPANQIVSNQTYQITLGTLFYLCDPWPRQWVVAGTMVTAAAGHGISLATEESKYKKIK